MERPLATLPDGSERRSSLTPSGEPTVRPAIFGLRWKIGLLAILLAVLPVLLSSLSQVSATEDELESAVHDRLLATGSSLLDQIRLALEPARAGLLLLSGALADRSLGPDAKLALLGGAVERLPDVLAIGLAAEGARPALALKARLKERLDAAGLVPEAVFAAPLGARDPDSGRDGMEVGDPVLVQSLDTWMLPLWLPLGEQVTGRPTTLVALLDLSALRRSFAARSVEEGGCIWLVDRPGRPVFSRSSLPRVPELDAFTRVPVAANPGVLVVTGYHDADGVAQLAAIGVSQDTGWTLLVSVPEARAYATASRMRSDLVWWMTFGVLGALLGAAILAQRISRPVREMALVTDRVGRGDFSARVAESRRRDEIGLLGRRLNRMIARLSEAQGRLHDLAYRDFLTDLPNRRSVFDRFDRVVAESARHGERIALFFLDLDRFKRVNDSLGHTLGDQLLMLAAERLRGQLGPGAIAARLGGDEFLVVLREAGERAEIERTAVRLVDAFRLPFSLKGHDLFVGVSIGISLAPDDGSEVSDLIDKADMAMYLAKERGRGHYQFFDAALKAQAVRKLALDARLRLALERGELELYYQPQVEAGTGEIVAMEALARWPDPRGGFVSTPLEFIALAEENGLILELGDWVMEQACRQLQAWHAAGLPRIGGSINVSALQFRRQDFLERVLGVLERTGLAPCYLGLELTESMLLDDVERSIRLMGELRDLGVPLMIDDFGTGYSSLAYLRRFPVDYVKVAQEFVFGIESNANDATIVGAVIALAKSLGLKTIAEGVETSGQLDFLRARDCDLVQGYYSGKPLTASEFAARLGLPPPGFPAVPAEAPAARLASGR